MKTIYVVIGSDTDPDRPGFVPGLSVEEGKGWHGMLEGIPKAKEALCDVKDSSGHAPVFTWCLRVDYQMQAINGSFSYVLENHRDFLLNLEKTGDELAWHPHFWNLNKTTGKWQQEIRDVDWQVSMLADGFRAYEALFPGRPRSVRMGWDYHNDRTIGKLAELGIVVDFSGIPGWKIDPPKSGEGGYNCYDWRLSPNRPYYPSAVDYRRPIHSGEKALRLLEAPAFVSTSLFWSAFAGAVMTAKMKNPRPLFRSVTRPTYWIAITGKPALFSPILAAVRSELRRSDTVFLTTYFHPDEFLLAPQSLYSLENMKANLESLIDSAKSAGAEIRFVQAQEIPKLVQI